MSNLVYANYDINGTQLVDPSVTSKPVIYNPTGKTLGVIGDSRDDRAFGGDYANASSPGTWAQSYSSLKWALSTGGQPFKRVADFSKSASGLGNTVTTAAVHPNFFEQMASVLAIMPAYCWIRVPTNDIQNGASAVATFSLFKKLVDTVLAAGILVELVACTLLDSSMSGLNGGGTYNAAVQAEIIKLNDLVRGEYAGKGTMGVVFHDTASIAMQQGVTTYAGVTGAYRDITHFLNIGAYAEGSYIGQNWLARFKPLPLLGRYAGDVYRGVPANNGAVGTILGTGSSNYLPNGMFDLGTPVSGVAQGWTVAVANNCTWAASIVPAPLWDGNTDGMAQQIVITQTAASSSFLFSSANMFTDLKLLRRYVAAALISIQAGAVNLKNIKMELVVSSNITFNDVHGLVNTGDDVIPILNTNGGTELAVCDLDLSQRPDLAASGGSASFRLQFSITFGTAATGGATVLLSRGANRLVA